MTLKWQFVVSLAATLSFFTVSYPYRSVDAGPAGPVLQATGPAGIVFLDTGNGTISYCTNPVDTNPTPVAPLGKCMGIGAIPSFGLANLRAGGFVAASGGNTFFVGNLSNGVVIQCAAAYNSTTQQGSGSCIVIANPIP